MIKFYTEYAAKWEKAVGEAKILDTELKAPEYENAILLPLRKRKDSPTSAVNGWFEGGVCTSDYGFIAGHDRKYPSVDANYACTSAYVPNEVQYRDETVIFGGVLYNHFGNLMIESLSRMWYYAKNPDTPYKYVFLMMEGHKTYHKVWFDVAGFTEDRYEVITQATQFKKVIVPDQTFFALSAVAHPEWLAYFDLIRKKVSEIQQKSDIQKVYLTRTQCNDKTTQEINEAYYEAFYEKLGYTIIAPEKLPLTEQINIIMNASELVSTLGTLSHMAVFAAPDVRCTFLLREPARILRPQVAIDQLKNYSCVYVEATKAILPSTHEKGVPLYYPTKYLADYAKENNLLYEEKDSYEEMQAITTEYLYKYALNYRNPSAFKHIANYTAFDFVNTMNYALYGIKLDKKKYQKPKIVVENEELRKENPAVVAQNEKLKEENQKLKKELAKSKKELEKIKKSTSWKITKPIRSVVKLFRKKR